MMLAMNAVAWSASVSRTILCTIFFALVLTGSGFSKQWDTEGADLAFQQARQKREEIAKLNNPAVGLYLECAKAYRKVHLKDPHYAHAGDAIYEEALLYQEMGDRFASLDFYKTAAKRFYLLTSQYSGSVHCPEALLRLGNIYERNIKDETAAQDTYRLLKTQYRYSSAARQLDSKNPPPAKPAAREPVKDPPAPMNGQSSPSTVQNIRYWTTAEYTRVTIDFDSHAKFSDATLSNPDRVYFDISNAKLGRDLHSQSISVQDGVLQQIRIGPKIPETIRVVLDLNSKGNYSVTELNNPFRVVIDLYRVGRNNPAASKSLSEAKSQTALSNTKSVAGDRSSREKDSHAMAVEMSTRLQPATINSPDRGLISKPKEPPRAITEMQSSPAIPAKTQSPPEARSAKLPMESRNESDSREIVPSDAVLAAKVTLPLSVTSGRSANAPKTDSDSSAKDPGEKKSESTQTGQSSPAFPKAANLTSRGNRTMTRMLGLKIGRIVIDPGHGGHDLGTIGPGGLYEKDLVLAMARDLQELIMQRMGAEVILTRNDDSFISLEERTAIANQYRADLFISIHANSSRLRSTSGVETYYLDFAKTNAEREIAARENAATTSSIHELENLIKKIAQADKSAESRELALMVQKSLFAEAKKVIPSTQDRGVRSAPFIVLIGANMPSVLAEIAFISNPNVEKILKKESGQEPLVKALFSGIEDYMKTLGGELVQNQIPIK